MLKYFSVSAQPGFRFESSKCLLELISIFINKNFQKSFIKNHYYETHKIFDCESGSENLAWIWNPNRQIQGTMFREIIHETSREKRIATPLLYAVSPWLSDCPDKTVATSDTILNWTTDNIFKEACTGTGAKDLE